jgi:hypothetical protein
VLAVQAAKQKDLLVDSVFEMENKKPNLYSWLFSGLSQSPDD